MPVRRAGPRGIGVGLVVGALVGSTGCNDLLGIESATSSDSGVDAPSADSSRDGGATDAPVMDASGAPACLVVGPAMTDDAACPAPVTGTCGMGSLAGFSPTAVPPAPLHQGVCTPAQTMAIYDDCLGLNATNAACNNDIATPCYKCLITNEGAGAYGPVIYPPNNSWDWNIGGCIERLDPCNAPCAQAFLNRFECEQAACEANCPVTDAVSYASFVTCTTTADTCVGCEGYYLQSASCGALLTGPAAQCVTSCGSASADMICLQFIAPLFCGP